MMILNEKMPSKRKNQTKTKPSKDPWKTSKKPSVSLPAESFRFPHATTVTRNQNTPVAGGITVGVFIAPSDSLSLAALIVTVLTYAFFPTAIVRFVAAIAGLTLCFVLIFKSKWSYRWKVPWKVLLATSVALGIGTVCWKQLLPEINGSGMFRTSQQLFFINFTRRLDIYPSEWWVWITYQSSRGFTASPVPLLMYIRVTNLTDKPERIERYKVVLRSKQCGTDNLLPMPISPAYQAVWVRDGYPRGPVIDFKIDSFEAKITNPIPPSATVGGFLFFDSPVACNIPFGENVRVDYTYWTSRGAVSKSTANTVLTNRSFDPTETTVGLSGDPADFFLTGQEADFVTAFRQRFSDRF